MREPQEGRRRDMVYAAPVLNRAQVQRGAVEVLRREREERKPAQRGGIHGNPARQRKYNPGVI